MNAPALRIYPSRNTLVLVTLLVSASCAFNGEHQRLGLLDADSVSPEVSKLLVNTGLQPDDPRLVCANRRPTGTLIARVRCETTDERAIETREAEEFLWRIQR